MCATLTPGCQSLTLGGPNISGGIGPDGRMRPMSFEILAGLSSGWADLLPGTMIVEGPGRLLRMARSQFTHSWFDYDFMLTACLTGFQALEAAFRVLYPEAERTPFRALIRRARKEGILPDSIADLAEARGGRRTPEQLLAPSDTGRAHCGRRRADAGEHPSPGCPGHERCGRP